MSPETSKVYGLGWKVSVAEIWVKLARLRKPFAVVLGPQLQAQNPYPRGKKPLKHEALNPKSFSLKL